MTMQTPQFKRGAGNHDGTRWRGKLTIPAHAHPLVRELIKLANEEMTGLTEIANRAGLRPSTVFHWRRKSTPNLANFVAALNTMDYDLKIEKKRR
jgi:hypothetical protein